MQHIARVLLDAEKPVSIDTLFDFPGGTFSIKKPSKSDQRRLLETWVSRNYIRKISDKYEVVDHEFLSSIGLTEEPADSKVFDVGEYAKMSSRYNFKQAEKHGRVCVAYRVIKRLSTCKNGQIYPRAALFIPKKGDKFEEKAAWTPTWHDSFLIELINRDLIELHDDKGTTYYRILDQDKIKEILDGANGVCVHILLWPNEPCKEKHEKLAVELPSDSKESEDPAPQIDEILELDPKSEEKKLEEVKPESMRNYQFGLRHSRNFRSSVESDSEESKKTTTKLETEDVADALFNHLKAQADSLKSILQFMTAVTGKLEDVDTNVRGLKSELEESRKDYKAIDSQVSNMRKRLSEIEKISSQSDQTMSAMSSEQKSTLSEMTINIGKMKQFVDSSQTSNQERSKAMEKSIAEIHVQNRKIGVQLSELEDRISAKEKSKLPVLVKKFDAVAVELENLKGLFIDRKSVV